MTHPGSKAHIPEAVKRRLEELKTMDRNGVKVIPDFAIFIDTHRDQPHVGVFHEDIHRGMCRPTMVDYLVEDDLLFDSTTGRTMQRHDKHLFVEPDWFSSWLVNYLMENGADPRDGEGVMPTSHFRDARAKRYQLRSFRQIVVERLGKQQAEAIRKGKT